MTTRSHRRQFLARGTSAALALASGLGIPAVLRGAEPKWGDLVGRIVYDGKAPPRAKLKVDKDLECCGKFDIRDESLMVAYDGGLANVFIYLRSLKVAIHPELAAAVEKRVTLDNRDCVFIPHCMTIWHTKQEFHTVNSDPVAQNIAFSPLGDVPANIVLPVDGEATHRFNRKQSVPVPIACNYHPWESGYILPRDNPYMAISQKDGTFRIGKLPAEVLEFQAWQERVRFLDTPRWPKGRFTVTIKPGTNDLGVIKVDSALLAKKQV